MQPWWWRSVAACVSVLVLAGLVAVVAGAVTADRATAVRLATEATRAEPPDAAEPTGSPAAAPTVTPTPEPPAIPEPPRAVDDVSRSSLAVLEDWRAAPGQDVIETPAGRFGAAVQRGAGTVVLVGRADPARVAPSPDPATADLAALGAESQRLAQGYAEILAPEDRSDVVVEESTPIAGLPTRTTVRRVASGELTGALVRISTVAAPDRTIAVLGVARPGPTLDADAGAADEEARSLVLEP